ncbi:MAG: ChaN family lipoprotein [Planctomycetes bacterium]|nr:ChaN family lipoprotein [Planctomycetota bacterium]
MLSVISALSILGACSPARFGWPDAAGQPFDSYREEFERAVGARLVEAVPRDELLRRIRARRALWLGDHHRHGRLHALHSELLDQLVRAGERLALGLEAIGVRDQPDVDAYLAGRIDMQALRERMRTRWAGSWLDDPELDPWFFRSLLAFARQHAIPVFALEPTPRLPLPARDEYIARTVADARRRHRDRLLVVLVGQTHLRGAGDVVARSGVDGVVVGGLPTRPLLDAGPSRRERGTCWRSDGDVLWFGEMFPR